MPLLTDAEIADMRGEVVNTQLDMTCTVRRDTGNKTDPYEPTTNWTNHYVLKPCHYWEVTEEEITGEANAVVTREQIVFEANTDIRTNDKIIDVVGVDGVEIADELNILEVVKQLNHVMVVVRGTR